jgi:hypothetical protein
MTLSAERLTELRHAAQELRERSRATDAETARLVVEADRSVAAAERVKRCLRSR